MDKGKYGKLITFEGIEGSGKSTLAIELYNYLKNKNFNVIFTREPGGSKLGEKIRELLLSSEFDILDWSELFLFLASRYDNTKKIIEPALREGKIVICDRYLDSSVAYQGYGRALNFEIIKMLNDIVTLNIKPDITFLIDIPEELSIQRIKGKNLDRIENETRDFYRKVRLGYIEIAKNENDRFVILDGKMQLSKLREKVIKITEKFLRGSI